MGKYKRIIGFCLGILLGLLIWFVPLAGLSPQGHACLALSLGTVIFWAFGVAQPGYVSGLYLLGLAVFDVAPKTLIFSTWTTSMMYLIIGAYLIATAVRESGLGERIAYWYISKYVTNYNSIIISIFALTFILSLLIPHPWPRAFLIMSVMAVVIKSADMPRDDAVKIGFTVFTASIPVSMIFLTGDASINPLAAQYCLPTEVGWIEWFKVMGIPMILTSIITMFMLMTMFKPTKEVSINQQAILEKRESLGAMTGKEIRTAFWVILAIILWMTDSIHGIDIGWVTLFIAVMMAMPKIGDILTPASWSAVPVQTLLFLTAAVAIGRVGGQTGMNTWLAQTLLPSAVPENMFILGAFITVISIAIHMCFGSVVAVMGIVIPAMLAFTETLGISPIIPVMIAYTAINAHFILPFHNLAILVGEGEDNGMYSEKETIRFGLPYTLVLFVITCAIQLPWWKFIGLW
ncbi:SLC13 family permease [Veillonella sp. T11011-6]|jgi:anion transporter|uniref:SLC13 family permease n=1 Tax=Veillonella sp. T11011-6 TaxID=2027459 RepID=UPI000CF561FB|nr:SLC13 family permease [Veillonella sp. T11011-6]PQL11473.1 cation transporter [Veillonella sp. T11011-6]